MQACQDNRGLLVNSIPDDVREAPQHRPAVPAIPLGIREWVLSNAREQPIERFAELTAQTFVLSVVPVLYCDDVELRRATKQDA